MTSSGGVSREPSAAAYTMAKLYVLNHNTSSTEEGKKHMISDTPHLHLVNTLNNKSSVSSQLLVYSHILTPPHEHGFTENKSITPSIVKRYL